MLRLTNLLNDVDALGPLLVERAAAGDHLNAFLLAAGMQQIAEDHVHRDPLFLHRAARRLRRHGPSPGMRGVAAATSGAGGLLWRCLLTTPGHRATEAWLAGLAGLGQRLAARLMDVPESGPPQPGRRSSSSTDLADYSTDALEAEARALVARLPRLPGSLRRGLLRLPSCFRSFDQSPEDVRALADAFARRWPERDRPLLVVGIRTSGSYLAPLAAAALRRLGFDDVRAATLRPGQRWLGREARLLRRVAGAGGTALVIDDPPRSWGSVARAVRELGRFGFTEARTVLLLATFADAPRPPAELEACPAVVLPFADWAIRRRLAPDRVRASLSALLGGSAELVGLRPLGEVPAGARRGHVRAVYEVELRADGETNRRLVLARGVGLGYLGEHALAVAERLRGRTTHVFGLDRGLLFEALPPLGRRLEAPLVGSQAAAVAAYVAERARALALPDDPARRLFYRGAAWQVAGQALGGLFGRASEPGRLVGMAVARRLLAVERPAVVDGRTGLDAFASGPAGDGLVKSDFDTGVFSSEDLYCFDPVFDVALAAAGADAVTAERLRYEFQSATGRRVEPERWLLYQLVHDLAAREKLRPEARHVDQRPARLLLRYYREVLLADLEPQPGGPLCAIDVDGVLESTPLGFPATSPSGALALRALNRHGYRAVLATGRSLDEVRDRCAAYRLAGGVAEYGAAVYLAGSGEVRSLLDPRERDALERVRAALAEAGDVHLDPTYRHSVRAFRLDDRGRRLGLPAGRVARALASGAEGLVRPVPGRQQTDFIGARTDKSRGLRALACRLGAGADAPLALAVGDTASDLGMLGLATTAIAPGNADAAVRRARGVTVVRPAAQAGLAAAVARLVGHRPGGCERCAAPPLPGSSRLLLDLLEVEDLSRWRKAARACRLLLQARSQLTPR